MRYFDFLTNLSRSRVSKTQILSLSSFSSLTGCFVSDLLHLTRKQLLKMIKFPVSSVQRSREYLIIYNCNILASAELFVLFQA